MNIIIILAACAILTLIAVRFAIHCEKRDFNKGKCVHCGRPLVLFDIDSQDGRGYVCEQCSTVVWVSYDCVDKSYREWWKKK